MQWKDVANDGRCFWLCLARALGDSPEGLRDRAIDYASEHIHDFVALQGGSEDGWAEMLDRHRNNPYEYADPYVIAPAAAALNVTLLVWHPGRGGEDTVWLYEPVRSTRVVVLRLAHEHFNVSSRRDSQQFVQTLRPHLTQVPMHVDARMRGGGTCHTKDEVWKLVGLNVTSLRKHVDSVLSLDAQVYVLSEITCNPRAYASSVQHFDKHGYNCVGRASCPEESRGHNGVLLAARRPFTLVSVEDVGPLTPWRNKGRLEAAWLHPPNGDRILLVGVYASAPDEDDRQAQLTALVEWLALIPHTPILVAGDFNCPVQDHLDLQVAVTAGNMVDIVQEVHGHRSATTHYDLTLPGADHSPLDHFLLSPTCAASAVDARVVHDFTFERHFPLELTLGPIAPLWKETLLAQPAPLPPGACVPLADEASLLWSLPGADEFYAALNEADVTTAITLWLQRWEKLLLDRADATDSLVTSAMQGRSSL
eukprot:6492021-Amphidinium_carterae.1